MSDPHGWVHPQCHLCWFEEYGRSRPPHRIADAGWEKCCYCGRDTLSGIYRRIRPDSAEIRHCPDLTVHDDTAERTP